MKSPFPGMDPWLERYWRSVHHALITYAHDQLQAVLPPGLRARIDERVFVEDRGAGEARGVFPDVYVAERRAPAGQTPRQGTGSALAEPLVIRVADDPAPQGYLEIVEAGSGGRVVTVIEFLSPSNKLFGEGRALYLQKQREVRASSTNLVEIDLTRTGERCLAISTWRIPPSHRTIYQVSVWRARDPLRFEVYAVPLQQPLPAIGVPLREGDPDAALDLQALLDQCYRNGRYDDLDYRADPEPPLTPEEAAWAHDWLRQQGKR